MSQFCGSLAALSKRSGVTSAASADSVMPTRLIDASAVKPNVLDTASSQFSSGPSPSLKDYITEAKAFRNAAFQHMVQAMTALPSAHMTVDEYLAWAEHHPGRYELCEGAVTAMSPEGAGHAERKAAVYAALLAAIRRRGVPSHALPDGMTVRIDDATAYEPDAVVYCGAKLPPTAV